MISNPKVESLTRKGNRGIGLSGSRKNLAADASAGNAANVTSENDSPEALPPVPSLEQVKLQAFVTYKGQRIVCKFNAFSTVKETIIKILPDFFQKPGAETEHNPQHFKLWKIDRSSPGSRVWLENDRKIRIYGLSRGDELMLSNIEESETLMVTIPPATILHNFEYGINIAVGDVQAILTESGFIDPGIKNTLYTIHDSVYGSTTTRHFGSMIFGKRIY